MYARILCRSLLTGFLATGLLLFGGALAAGDAMAQQLKKLPDQPVGNAQQQDSAGQTGPVVKPSTSNAGPISPGAQSPTVRPDPPMGKGVISSKEALRPRPPVLTVMSGGGDFAKWSTDHVFNEPEEISFRWSTTTGSYAKGEWQVSTRPFGPVAENASSGGSKGTGGSLGSQTGFAQKSGGPPKAHDWVIARGETGPAPAPGGSTARFKIRTSGFVPSAPEDTPTKYYVRVVPLDAEGNVAGPASHPVTCEYRRPEEPTQFTDAGLYASTELGQAKHDAAIRVRTALARIVQELEYLNPAYGDTDAAKRVRGGNYDIFDGEILEPYPWDGKPLQLAAKAEAWVSRAHQLATKGPLVLDDDYEPADLSGLESALYTAVEALIDVDLNDYEGIAEDNIDKKTSDLFGSGSGAPVGSTQYWEDVRARVLLKVGLIVEDAKKWNTSRP